jgi:predicted SprT family Zn-dependent metalloprotease
MNPMKAVTMAQDLLRHHGLAAQGWRFQFDKAKRRFGVTKFRTKVIGLSSPLVVLNGETEVLDTILHEVAHALCGSGVGHGRLWKATAKAIGCSAERCYDSTEVAQPKARWEAYCPSCDYSRPAFRRSRKARACRACCARHSNGRFDSRFSLLYRRAS